MSLEAPNFILWLDINYCQCTSQASPAVQGSLSPYDSHVAVVTSHSGVGPGGCERATEFR